MEIAVYSAGISGKPQTFYDLPTAEFERIVKVNLTGAFLFGKAVAKRMLAAGTRGTIIHISSVGSVLGVGDSMPYCVSKAALGMLTKTMALSLAEHGIRVNAIGPGQTIYADGGRLALNYVMPLKA